VSRCNFCLQKASTGIKTGSFTRPVLFLSVTLLTFAQAPVHADPELRATAHTLPGVVIPRGHSRPLSAGTNQNNFSLGADQAKFNLGTDQSKFNLGTSRSQSNARSDVGIKVDKENPAIMTIVGGNEADIQKLLAKRYHRTVIPLVPYQAPAGPMQQVINQQQVNGQALTQQVVAQQTLSRQGIISPQINNWQQGISAMPIETVNRFFNIFAPTKKPGPGELSAEAKPLKPFGEATYVRWDPWYRRIQAASTGMWQTYNNQLNTEVTAHVTVYAGCRLAVTGCDVNIWKSAHPWDAQFNDASRQAALEVLNKLKGSPLLRFPTHTRRSEVSFDLVFSTGGRGGVGISAPINDVETIYGL
jgi:hypothetical protein